MNTQENNRLIAEFMGTYHKCSAVIPFDYEYGEEMEEGEPIKDYDSLEKRINDEVNDSDAHQWYIEEVNYHTSWDWLMPVVEKCNKLYSEGAVDSWELMTALHESVQYADIEATYKALVEFIKWYNKNK